MAEVLAEINRLLVEVYNDLLYIEENALKKGKFNDISITEMHTIEAIGMYNPKSMSKIAKSLNITVGTLSVAINNLVKKGYVSRCRSENDRRVVMIKLTKKGRLAYRVHDKFHKDMVKSLIEGLTKGEEIILSSSLLKLKTYLIGKYMDNKGEE